MSERFQRGPIYGVDFSGSVDAGSRIWIARGAVEDGRLRIENCLPASNLPGAGKHRETAIAALRQLVESAPDAVFGFDFPFSLPVQLLAALGISDWESLVRSLPELFPTPEAFRAACLEAAGGRELRRETDRAARTPFSAYNVRLYLQAYFGISDLLRPLVQAGLAIVPPLQSAEPGKPWLLEICPASTLRRIEIYYGPYKGLSPAHSSVRRVMLTSIEKKGPLYFADPATREIVLANTGGDALDSVVAAFAAFKNLQDPSFDIFSPSTDQPWRMEGYVYT